MKKFSFRFFAISIFAFLSFLIVGVIFYTHSNFSKELTKDISNVQFDILFSDYSRDLSNLELSRKSSMNIFVSFFKTKNSDDVLLDKTRTIKIFADFLNRHRYVYSVYVSSKDNKILSLAKARKHEIGILEHRADDNDKWFCREISNGIEKRTYYDENFNITFSKNIKSTFKVEDRPWYKLASKYPQKVVRTSPYEFDLFRANGVTYAKEYKEGYVFALDLLTKKMSQILENRAFMKTRNACLVDRDFNIIAQTESLDYEIAKKIFKLSRKGFKNGTKTIDGKKYIYKVKPDGNDFLIVFSDFDTLMNPFKHEFKKNILVAGIVIGVLCMSIWFLASVIIKPMLLLARENRKIASREFEEVEYIKSNIKEVSDLSNSLVNMSKSIQNHQEELERLTITDSLTKVYNRTKLNMSLRVRMDDFNRYGHEFGFIMVDIDFFKRVNDEFGHQVGDEVLVEIVHILKNGIRKNDIIGRWGGEEFAIVCKEINILNIEKLAQKLRRDIETHVFETVGHRTASFGVSICYEGDSVERLVNRADEALYRAKKRGRNRVEVG